MNKSQPPTKNSTHKNTHQNDQNTDTKQHDEPLKQRQQQFLLKFCWQLARVVEACKHSETAEIEVGRRSAGKKQIRVKLLAERDTHLPTSKGRPTDDG